jgi:hypothetical protein
MPEEIGRIIRGQFEEIWAALVDDRGLMVRYERLQVAGPERVVEHLRPREVYQRPVKDKLLAHVLFADTRYSYGKKVRRNNMRFDGSGRARKAEAGFLRLGSSSIFKPSI